jgi:hypothetical protein
MQGHNLVPPIYDLLAKILYSVNNGFRARDIVQKCIQLLLTFGQHHGRCSRWDLGILGMEFQHLGTDHHRQYGIK